MQLLMCHFWCITFDVWLKMGHNRFVTFDVSLLMCHFWRVTLMLHFWCFTFDVSLFDASSWVRLYDQELPFRIDTCISENKQLLYWPLYKHGWKNWQIDWKKMTALVHLSKTRTRTSSGRNTHTFATGLFLLLMQEAKKVILVCKDGERQLKLFNMSGSES